MQGEPATHQTVGKIEFRTVEVEEALAVDNHFRAIALEDLVSIARFVHVHPVLQSGTAAAHNLDAESLARLFCNQGLDLQNCIVG